MATKRKIKRYKVSPDESLCLAVSVVDSPAVESNFLFFNEQKMEKFVGVEGERRMIYGCALRSDFPIYRNNGKEEYWLEFDADAIDKLSKNYFKMGFQSNWTAAHKEEVEGLTITESWIKEDMVADKSIALGLDPDIAVGSWFIGCYCENDNIWQQVIEGKFHGFSCEALVGLEEFDKQIENNITNNDNNMNLVEDMNFWKKMKETIKEAFKKSEEELAEESGFTSVEDYKKEVEAIKEELEEETPTVETPIEPPVTPTEPSKDAEPTTTPTGENKPSEDETPEEKDNHLEDILKSVRAEVEALRELNKDLTAKVKEMEKQPSAKPISTNTGKGNKGDTFDNWMSQMEKYYR